MRSRRSVSHNLFSAENKNCITNLWWRTSRDECMVTNRTFGCENKMWAKTLSELIMDIPSHMAAWVFPECHHYVRLWRRLEPRSTELITKSFIFCLCVGVCVCVCECVHARLCVCFFRAEYKFGNKQLSTKCSWEPLCIIIPCLYMSGFLCASN